MKTLKTIFAKKASSNSDMFLGPKGEALKLRCSHWDYNFHFLANNTKRHFSKLYPVCLNFRRKFREKKLIHAFFIFLVGAYFTIFTNKSHYNSRIISRLYPVCLNFSRTLDQLTLSLKVTALEQFPVVLFDVLKERHGGPLVSQAGKSHGLLVEQWLQSQVVTPTVV